MTAGSATAGESFLDRMPRGNRAVAWAGVLLGLLAFFVALPPIAAESPVWPVLFGFLGIAAGARSSSGLSGSGSASSPRSRETRSSTGS